MSHQDSSGIAEAIMPSSFSVGAPNPKSLATPSPSKTPSITELAKPLIVDMRKMVASVRKEDEKLGPFSGIAKHAILIVSAMRETVSSHLQWHVYAQPGSKQQKDLIQLAKAMQSSFKSLQKSLTTLVCVLSRTEDPEDAQSKVVVNQLYKSLATSIKDMVAAEDGITKLSKTIVRPDTQASARAERKTNLLLGGTPLGGLSSKKSGSAIHNKQSLDQTVQKTFIVLTEAISSAKTLAQSGQVKEGECADIKSAVRVSRVYVEKLHRFVCDKGKAEYAKRLQENQNSLTEALLAIVVQPTPTEYEKVIVAHARLEEALTWLRIVFADESLFQSSGIQRTSSRGEKRQTRLTSRDLLDQATASVGTTLSNQQLERLWSPTDASSAAAQRQAKPGSSTRLKKEKYSGSPSDQLRLYERNCTIIITLFAMDLHICSSEDELMRGVGSKNRLLGQLAKLNVADLETRLQTLAEGEGADESNPLHKWITTVNDAVLRIFDQYEGLRQIGDFRGLPIEEASSICQEGNHVTNRLYHLVVRVGLVLIQAGKDNALAPLIPDHCFDDKSDPESILRNELAEMVEDLLQEYQSMKESLLKSTGYLSSLVESVDGVSLNYLVLKEYISDVQQLTDAAIQDLTTKFNSKLEEIALLPDRKKIYVKFGGKEALAALPKQYLSQLKPWSVECIKVQSMSLLQREIFGKSRGELLDKLQESREQIVSGFQALLESGIPEPCFQLNEIVNELDNDIDMWKRIGNDSKLRRFRSTGKKNMTTGIDKLGKKLFSSSKKREDKASEGSDSPDRFMKNWGPRQ